MVVLLLYSYSHQPTVMYVHGFNIAAFYCCVQINCLITLKLSFEVCAVTGFVYDVCYDKMSNNVTTISNIPKSSEYQFNKQ